VFGSPAFLTAKINFIFHTKLIDTFEVFLNHVLKG